MRKRVFWMVFIALVVGGGGYIGYTRWLRPQTGGDGETVLRTATVSRGNISITAAGSGTLVASSQASLAFSSNTRVEQILVGVGDRVGAGDVLAWADDTAARQALVEAEQAVMDAQMNQALAVGQAELKVIQAEADLAAAQQELTALLDWVPDPTELDLAKASLSSAQISYQNTVARAGMVDQQNASVRINLDQAMAALADAQQTYAEAMNPERDWERNIGDTRAAAAASVVRAQQSLEIAQASYDLAMIDGSRADVNNAWSQVVSAGETVARLEDPPTDEAVAAAQRAVRSMELALQQAQLELGEDTAVARRRAELTLQQAELRLATAQEALDGMTLVAPFAGTVVEVNIKAGETASGTAIVLADLDNPVVQFWVEESDMQYVALGNRVEVGFTALPDLVYRGEIFRVDPQLVTVGNTPAVEAWATLDAGAHGVSLLSDMNADVDVVDGEALDAVLVPVQALRRLGENAYAVFVVQPDGELELRLVEIGLQDFVNAEIISGLVPGEIVSAGEATQTSGGAATVVETGSGLPEGAGQMIFEGGGGFMGRP